MHTHLVMRSDVDDRAITTHSVHDAELIAKALLEDDPELSCVEVYTADPFGEPDEYVGQACFAPDKNWDTVVVFQRTGLSEGALRDYARIARAIPSSQRDDAAAYDLDDPKQEGSHNRMSEAWDSREGK